MSALFTKPQLMPTKKSRRKSRANDWRSRDPEHESEQARYENPLPSRALIAEVLEKDGPLSLETLIEHLHLKDEDSHEGFRRRLEAMVRDGELLKNRRGAYGQATAMNLVAGRVIGHRDGFGFLSPDEEGTDIFLPPREMDALMSGDRVLVRPSREGRDGKREGVVVEVLERANKTIAGRLIDEHGVHLVVPANPKIVKDILIPPGDLGGAKPGQMVVAEIVSPPARRTLAVGRITEVIGDHLGPGTEIETAVRAFGLPHEWPKEVLNQVKSIPDHVGAKQMQGRVDLRDLPLLTIDGEDARDFDDAVYCEPAGKGFRVLVAIADVAAYVTPGSALDREAELRGTSVYFPEQVIPMLPEALSNGLCSLNPDVDRLCMVCDMQLDANGEVKRSKFYEGVMKSHARLTYTQVADALEQPRQATQGKLGQVLPQLQNLQRAFTALFKAREQRGAIDFDSTETRIEFGEDRKIARIVPVQRNQAHRLIEECMIAANVQAALWVLKRKLPTLYRVHEVPAADKITALREYLSAQGILLGGGAEPQAADFAKVAQLARGRDDAPVIQMAILRTLMQARYTPEPEGHFGLALEHYAHFTSPIRRYPDLLLHRALKHLIHKRPAKEFAYDEDRMAALGEHCSVTERRAEEATRDVVNWLKCEYMSEHVGEEFDGVITGVAGFGVFVELSGFYVEGMVHVSALYNDYYEFDPRHQRLVGRRNGRTFKVGDTLKVKLTRVSLDDRKIDLELGGAANVKDGLSQQRPDSSPKRSASDRRSTAGKPAGAGKPGGRKQGKSKATPESKAGKKSPNKRKAKKRN